MNSEESDGSTTIAFKRKGKELDNLPKDLDVSKTNPNDEGDGIKEELFALELSQNLLKEEMNTIDMIWAPEMRNEQREDETNFTIERFETRVLVEDMLFKASKSLPRTGGQQAYHFDNMITVCDINTGLREDPEIEIIFDYTEGTDTAESKTAPRHYTYDEYESLPQNEEEKLATPSLQSQEFQQQHSREAFNSKLEIELEESDRASPEQASFCALYPDGTKQRATYPPESNHDVFFCTDGFCLSPGAVRFENKFKDVHPGEVKVQEQAKNSFCPRLCFSPPLSPISTCSTLSDSSASFSSAPYTSLRNKNSRLSTITEGDNETCTRFARRSSQNQNVDQSLSNVFPNVFNDDDFRKGGGIEQMQDAALKHGALLSPTEALELKLNGGIDLLAEPSNDLGMNKVRRETPISHDDTHNIAYSILESPSDERTCKFLTTGNLDSEAGVVGKPARAIYGEVLPEELRETVSPLPSYFTKSEVGSVTEQNAMEIYSTPPHYITYDDNSSQVSSSRLANFKSSLEIFTTRNTISTSPEAQPIVESPSDEMFLTIGTLGMTANNVAVKPARQQLFMEGGAIYGEVHPQQLEEIVSPLHSYFTTSEEGPEMEENAVETYGAELGKIPRNEALVDDDLKQQNTLEIREARFADLGCPTDAMKAAETHTSLQRQAELHLDKEEEENGDGNSIADLLSQVFTRTQKGMTHDLGLHRRLTVDEDDSIQMTLKRIAERVQAAQLDDGAEGTKRRDSDWVEGNITHIVTSQSIEGQAVSDENNDLAKASTRLADRRISIQAEKESPKGMFFACYGW